MEVPEWLDLVDPRIREYQRIGEQAIEEVAEQWKTTGMLADPETFAKEDEEDRGQLVRYSDAVEACYAMRDEILTRELPEVMAGIWDNMNRTFQNMISGLHAWVTFIGRGDLAPLVKHFRNLALQNSPRGFIGRVNATRERHEQLLRKKALFPRSEKRYQRKISQRRF